GWLYGVARRVALKARSSRTRYASHLGLVAAAELADARSDPLAELTARDVLTVLDEEVQRLPEAYRLPVLLCCLEGKTQEEAARLLGWTQGSVKGRLERGRARLHAQLTRRGLSLAAALGAAEVARGLGHAAVPASLADTTVRAATSAAAGQGVAAGLISANVV